MSLLYVIMYMHTYAIFCIKTMCQVFVYALGTDYLRYGRFELRAWSRSELNFNLKAPLYQWKNTQQVFPTSLMWRKSRASKVMA